MNIRKIGAGISVPLALSSAALLAGPTPANAATPTKTSNISSPSAVKPGDDVHCLNPSMCYEDTVYKGQGSSEVGAKCAKAAAADAATAGLATVVTTSPVDFPGVITVTSITFLGKDLFCLAGWS